MVRDFDPTLYRNSMLAHAALGKLFDLPVVMTTSAQQGPNGPLPKEILEMYPNAPLIKRQGEVDAWDNPDFRAAVKASGKRQIVLAGIVTDVCKSCSHMHTLTPHISVSFSPSPSLPATTQATDQPLSYLTLHLQARHSPPSPFAQKATPSGPTSKPAAQRRTSSPTRPTCACRPRACSW